MTTSTDTTQQAPRWRRYRFLGVGICVAIVASVLADGFAALVVAAALSTAIALAAS